MKTVLRFKKKRQNELFIAFILLLTLFYGIIDLVHISAIKYTMDIAWLFLLIALVRKRFRVPSYKELKGSISCIWVFWAITLIGFILNIGAPQYYLWGFRNNFRFFVYFLACITFLDGESVDDYLWLMNMAYYLHFAAVLVQYLAFGIKQDYLGGIFGTQAGNNGFSLIFILIIMTYSLLRYLNKREALLTFAVKGIMAILISVHSELKFFFVAYALIVVLCLLFTKFSYKKLYITVCVFVGIAVGVELLTKIFPYSEDWFSWDTMVETVFSGQGYTGKGDFNRMTAIPTVWNMFLETWGKRLFGLGLGNCDNSAFSFLTTPFYVKYNHLHYHWFSSSFALVETGLLGLGAYILFFVMTFLGVNKRQKTEEADIVHCQLANVMSIVAIILIVYNQSMRTEAGYMMYFVLALPFIRKKCEKS